VSHPTQRRGLFQQRLTTSGLILQGRHEAFEGRIESSRYHQVISDYSQFHLC
jgi:hypothetical protein